MRSRLLIASFAVAAVAGLATGVAAADTDRSPTAPETTVADDLDIFSDLGLDAEQIQCLLGVIGTEADMNALLEAVEECGVSLDQAMEMDEGAPATQLAQPPSTVEGSEIPADIDGDAAAAALALLGLDDATIDCIVAEGTSDAPGELVFFNCGVGLPQLLEGILALAALADGSVPAPPATTEAVDAPATVEPTGNEMLDLLLQGIDLDEEQRQCLADNAADVDPSDISALLELSDVCGIDIIDLIAGG